MIKGLTCVLLASVAWSARADYEQQLETVYSRLCTAMGLIEDPPAIKLETFMESYIAYMDYTDKVIAVEKKAMDVLATFGDRADDALALLLGHELAHYRFNHNWARSFSVDAAGNEISRVIDMASHELDTLKVNETQADHYAGIYAYLAGYDPEGLAGSLFEKLYDAYGLDEKLFKYADLGERIALANQNDRFVSQIIRVLEAGSYALLLGEFTKAQDCLEFVLDQGFSSREVYNNLGLAYAFQAQFMLGPNHVQFVYPFELDIESRIDVGGKGDDSDLVDEANRLLRVAMKRFSQAASFDPNYAAAHSNLACVYSMLGEVRKGLYHAEEAALLGQAAGETHQVETARTIEAILYYQRYIGATAESPRNDLKRAKTLLQSVITPFAEANLRIINGAGIHEMWDQYRPQAWSREEVIASAESGQDETVDGLNFDRANYSPKLTKVTAGKRLVRFEEKPTSIILFLELERKRRDEFALIFHRTRSGYSGSTAQGIQVDDPMAEVTKTYGEPAYTLNSTGGTLYCYKKPQIIIFERNWKVDGWMLYYFR